MRAIRMMMSALCMVFAFMQANAADYTTFLTSERGFTEVTAISDDMATPNDYYILVAAETTDLIVGVGRFEAKPDWASSLTKALRYVSAATDPVLDITNFFTIEKANSYIGFRNVYFNTDLFQTHDNAGYMYVNTYTDANLDEWSYLIPTFQNGYWLFESGKYPMSSNNWACGYLGPWNNRVEAGEPIALNRRNTSDDLAGHYKLFHITKTQLLLLRQQALASATSSNPVDATWLIVNPSFETGDETGWSLDNKDPNGNDEFNVTDRYGMSNQDGSYILNAFQWWAPSLSVSQTVANVPCGVYELSAVVCGWVDHTVTLTGNETTVTSNGAGDQTGIPVSMQLSIGADQTLYLNAGSTGEWWNYGDDFNRTFFKVDDFRLSCKGLYVNSLALPLPNDETTLLDPDQWYYYDVDYPSDYLLIGNLTDMVYTTDGLKLPAEATTGTPLHQMTFAQGRVYFKTTRSDATLLITREKEVIQGSFTAVALNVDGLPNTVLTYELNPDGPGSDGSKKISQYLAEKAYDIMGLSEDFNFDGSLRYYLNDEEYGHGVVRTTLSVEGLLQHGFPFDTDGLNLYWKKSKAVASGETWKKWDSSQSGEGNQYVKKGYRYYEVKIDGQYIIDVYVLHMDAGGEDYAASREGQWRQLADAINNTNLTRPKLVIGDTNSRWTREDIGANFTNRLSSELTMSDVWVELCRGNVYPITSMDDITDQSNPTNFSNYEVVDKIFYINPKAANTLQLAPQSFWIEQDYTYGHVNGTNDTTPLGDHRPVVVNFNYYISGDPLPVEIDIIDDSDANSKTIQDYTNITGNVRLKDRTLVKSGVWNTLCLPFSLTTEQLAASPLNGATIKALEDASVTGYHVELTFGDDVNSITAGTPYIVKWANGTNAQDVVFENVTMANPTEADRTVEKADGHVKFIGYFDAFTIQPEEQPSIYYLTNNSKLIYTLKERTLNACRAYFVFTANTGAQTLDFSIDFGDSSAIKDVTSGLHDGDGAWYTLDGRRLSGKPSVKGVYVNNGRRVVVK